MPTLRLQNVPDPVNEFEVVDVSQWFGGDGDEPFTVNVYPLTVRDKNKLTQLTNNFERVTAKDGTVKIAAVPNARHDPSSVIAALCCRDDDRNLVFGVDEDDAIARVEGLPERYRPMIVMLATAALRGTADANKTVEDAAKNSEPTP